MTVTGLYRGVAVIFASLVLLAPAQAGFFDQLFGGMAPQQPSPSPFNYPMRRVYQEPRRYRSHPVKKAADEKPALQATTDVMHDPTLRFGDAVMLNSGIVVFTGAGRNLHHEKDFVAFKEAPIKTSEKTKLAAINVITPAPSAAVGAAYSHSGRSSAVNSGIVTIKDQRGKILRYVGP